MESEIEPDQGTECFAFARRVLHGEYLAADRNHPEPWKDGGPVDVDVALPMIATKDIGAAAAEALLKLEFKGKQTQELQGQRDLELQGVAVILGGVIGKRRA